MDNRRLIIETAHRLILEYGYEKLTIRGVCRQAKIAIGTFYYYFKTKDELLNGILEMTLEDFRNSRHSDQEMPCVTISDQIILHLRASISYWEDTVRLPLVRYLFSIYPENRWNHTQYSSSSAHYSPGMEVIHQLLSSRPVSPAGNSGGMTPEQLTDLIYFYLRGIIFVWILEEGKISLMTLAEQRMFPQLKILLD